MKSKKKATPRITIESLAKFLVEKKHAGYDLDFDKSVEQIGSGAWFTLKILSKEGKLIRVYLATITDKPISENSQPFNADMMGHLRKHETDPLENYYFAYILLNEKDQPHEVQIFSLPEKFREY